jgi:4-amino-4-deoxy-L-arabinose transferase-like glycosyltransferase
MEAVAWAGLISFLIVAALGTLFYPLGRDQGIFGWAGDVILKGGVPYLDAWDQKGPATYYTYALAQAAFGRNTWGIRVLDLLFVLAGCVFLRSLARQLGGKSAGTLAAVLFACLYFRLGYWSTAQPDGWASIGWEARVGSTPRCAAWRPECSWAWLQPTS